tara:strand:- start:207 stop:365 length:159 start_codon:yes stop_codon:yes gene_type:complete
VEGKNYLSALHIWKEGSKEGEELEGGERLGRVGRLCPALLNPNSLYTALVIL